MGYLAIIKEVLGVLWPLVLEIIKAARERELTKLGEDIRGARTKEEKRDAARKIADYLYRS